MRSAISTRVESFFLDEFVEGKRRVDRGGTLSKIGSAGFLERSTKHLEIDLNVELDQHWLAILHRRAQTCIA